MKRLRVLAAMTVTLVALGSWAAAASAHVTADPPTAQKGAGDQEITFRVPNEMDNANTISLQVQLPQDHPIAAVDALETPGWTSTVQMRHLATPIKTDDGSLSDVASVITWTGGKITPGHYGEFKILAMGLPTDTDQLVFKAVQGYDNGQTVAWIQTDDNADHPAPVVKLTAAADDSGTTTPTTLAATTTATSSKSTSSSDSTKGIAIAGLTVAVIALVIALAVLVTSRKKDELTTTS